MKIRLTAYILILFFISSGSEAQNKEAKSKTSKSMTYKIQKSDKEWKDLLTPAQFHIIREKGTESPGTGSYNLHFKKGEYACAACGILLFESTHKYDSHCGWPSFDKAIEGTVEYKKDTSLGRFRTEILCMNCGGHLGHVFDDGPQETTGKRYCVNSLSLEFKEVEE